MASEWNFESADTTTIWESVLVGQKRMSEVVAELISTERGVDEMGVLFPGSGQLLDFLSDVVREPEVTLFNHAMDTVVTEPLRSRYKSAYWFLTTGHQFRVEAMMIGEGSPLHTVIANKSGVAAICSVHASFKCFDEEDYLVSQGSLRNAGWEQVQRCTSAYGKFSYWAHMDQPPGWLLKPRLNLRDAS